MFAVKNLQPLEAISYFRFFTTLIVGNNSVFYCLQQQESEYIFDAVVSGQAQLNSKPVLYHMRYVCKMAIFRHAFSLRFIP